MADEIKLDEDKHEEKKFSTEDVDALFSGEELSEEFKTNAKAIFEAAVLAKVDSIKAELDEEYSKKLEEETQEFAGNLVDKIDEYLEYVVKEWAEENKVAIKNNLKAEVAEDFMVGLKNLFVENYVDIPEDKVDILEEANAKLVSAQEDLDKKIKENSDLISALNGYKKETLVREITEGLSEVQTEKLKSLAENIEFVSEQDYREKLQLTKQKYFTESKQEDTTAGVKKEDLDSDGSTIEESYSPIMEHYVRNISKIVKR